MYDEMTVEEIEKRVRHEKNLLAWCDEEVERLKNDRLATEKALAFWEERLEAAKKNPGTAGNNS